MRSRWGSDAPPEVRWLAVLTAASAAACAFSAAFPVAPGRPVGLLVVLTAVGVVLALVLGASGPRVTQRELTWTVIVVIVLASVLAGASSTTGGAILVGYGYIWITVYTALFLARRAMQVHVALITVGFGVALLASGLPDVFTAWLLVSATVLTAGHALSRLAERTRRQAETDHVTGLLNRHAFVLAAEREHELAARTGSDLTVAILDLDGFKAVNDRDGHAAGDRLLADLATAWLGALRPADVLARYGGDEFALLLPATSEAGAATLVGRLAAAHPQPWSAGVAGWPRSVSLDGALAVADARLYEVKRARAGDRG